MVQFSRHNLRRINTRKVIVVGAGIGGLSIALRLQKNGFNVTIVEKNSFTGGKTSLLKSDGFSFDLSATIFMLPKSYFELFDYIKEDYTKYFKVMPLDINYRVFYNDNTTYDFSPYLPKLVDTLNQLSSDDIIGLFSLIKDVYKKFNILSNEFLSSSLKNSTDIITATKALKLSPFKSCYAYLKKYIRNEKLLNFLLFQCMYVGASPFESSNLYTLVPIMTLIDGLWNIDGGLFTYVSTLEHIFLKKNGKILFNSEVKKICFDNNCAKGVELSSGEFLYSDLIICSCDYSHAVNSLIKESTLIKKLKYETTYKHSPSTFIIYLGLNKIYENLQFHNIFIGNNFNGNLNAPFNNKLSLNPPIYIFNSSKLNSNVTPNPNYQAINIMVRVPNLDNNNLDWSDPEFIKEYRDIIINILSQYDGFSTIENHIISESYLTPLTYKDTFNAPYGSAFGISHTTSQSLFLRPQCKLKNINNLYFVGASIHPGNGVSMVLNSSKIACDEILKDFS